MKVNGMNNWLTALLVLSASMCFVPATAQDDGDDEDIWRKVQLGEVDYQRSKSYCQRLYGYYRYVDDGIGHNDSGSESREFKLYRVCEGIFELDVRYGKSEDDGAHVIVGRDLVHPDRKGKFMDFYELTPYTFLQQARRDPKHFTIEASGDTTRVFARQQLAGIVVKDTLSKTLHMDYNALAPDTALSINLLLVKAKLNRVHADALYTYDETTEDYVPQGNLKRMTFDGSIDLSSLAVGGRSVREVFTEHTEIYIDSVAYLTRDEYRAAKKLTRQQRDEMAGYTDADIDRLKLKLGVPPLSGEQLERIEDQRDWDEQYEQWKNTLEGKKSQTINPLE